MTESRCVPGQFGPGRAACRRCALRNPCRVKVSYRISQHCLLLFDPAVACFQPCPSCADTPAPSVGLSALTPPKRGRLPAVHGLLGPARRSGPHPRRSAGTRRRGRGMCSRLAARTSSLRPPGRARVGLYELLPGPWPLPDRDLSTSRLPGPAGPGQQCHMTHASRGARVAPMGPAAAPPATWWSRGQPGRLGGCDLRSPPATAPRRPGWAQYKQGSGGGAAPKLAMQSGGPNTSWQCVISLRPNKCRRMNLPCRAYRVGVSRAELETTGLSTYNVLEFKFFIK